jgi:anti-sigma factor RsiW
VPDRRSISRSLRAVIEKPTQKNRISHSLQDYLDGRLPASVRDAVEARLSQDPGAAATVAAYRRQLILLRRLGHEALSEPVPNRLLNVLRYHRH